MSDAKQRVEALRLRLRRGAPVARENLEQAWALSGRVYVDTVGSVVEVANGETEFFYIPSILPARDNMLGSLRNARQAVYAAISAQLPPTSRILVIGAGGDTLPIKEFAARGHEVIATDFAEDVVRALQRKMTVPAFACDLQYLDEVLPEAVDITFGNSTLGYVDPSKLARVVENVGRSMTVGGVFTFDLAPHPHYFNMAMDTSIQTVANESSPNPSTLLRLIQQHGSVRGVAAMAIYSLMLTTAVHLAMIAVLRERFESAGFLCTTGEYYLRDEGGSRHPAFTLRVSRGDQRLLAPVANETLYDDPREHLARQDISRASLFMPFLDRSSGEALARELGIHQSWREDPWMVLKYLKDNPPQRATATDLHEEMLLELDPTRLAALISSYVTGKPFVPPKRLPSEVLFDQYTRKAVLVGDLDLSKEATDARIDSGYERARLQSSTGGDNLADIARPPHAPLPALSMKKVGRNEPCPCGSGKKFKKCHGA